MADVKISGLPASTVPLAGTEVLPIVQSGVTKKVAVSDLTAGRAISTTVLTSTVAIGTAPFVVTSTTNVANLNASSLNGATFAAPGAIGGTTASAITGTTITGTDTTEATSTTAAALKTAGGLAVAKKIYAGDNIVVVSGKGIDFSATAGTGTSELFADYEEGTFTPTLVGTTTDPTVTYSLQRGLYTKVGRIVTVTVLISWTAFSGGSGNVALGNLPFTVEGSVGAGSAGSVASFNGFTLSIGRTSVGVNAASNTTYGLVRCFGSAVTSQSVSVGDVAASGQVVYQITYST
jgi:hypothetical protein